MLFMWFNGMIKGLESVYEIPNNKAVMAVLILFIPLVLPIVAVVGLVALTMMGLLVFLMLAGLYLDIAKPIG